MSFGGVIVDQNNVTDRFPGLSLLTGLFALGVEEFRLSQEGGSLNGAVIPIYGRL